eukprot:1252056-Pyramimonas_sp.AAC.1
MGHIATAKPITIWHKSISFVQNTVPAAQYYIKARSGPKTSITIRSEVSASLDGVARVWEACVRHRKHAVLACAKKDKNPASDQWNML